MLDRYIAWARIYRAPMAAAAIGAVLLSTQGLKGQQSCDSAINPIVCENALPGNDPGEWDISGASDPAIQGFTTEISVNRGETVHFKVDTTASAFSIDIYRLGYYGGSGARKIATLSGVTGRSQPACLTDVSTGLVDCGNWTESASWATPATSVSGVYLARLTRTGSTGGSQIVFVVRDDDTPADVVVQTSDTTWQAYNTYGGHSLYVGGPGTNPSRAYKVSYNRPITTRDTSPEDFVFNAEYPMIRWLEANGYDVSYMTGPDTDRYGATELLRHRVFLAVGHDEYWSDAQRRNVETARDAGVSLGFFTGNGMFWKARWEPSIDGTGAPYRTLVSYKETHANKVIDPSDPPTWTGSWRDPRFSPPGDGGRPENAVMGTLFSVNWGGQGSNAWAITVPQAFANQPFWRNTRIATLPHGGTATLAAGTLGYEWDENVNNGRRPAGLITLSSTPRSVAQKLLDYGSTFGPGTATHALTLYRNSTGTALVFGAGTVQWSWGLDGTHDRGGSVPDLAMQQATVNLLYDMGVPPGSLQPGLLPGGPPIDTVRPRSTLTSPAPGATVPVGAPVTISGTASDAGGGVVALVEVSVDRGATWQPASGTSTWSYSWTPAAAGVATLESRATDNHSNREIPSAGVAVTVTPAVCPCRIWNGADVPGPQADDGAAVELGVKFQSDTDGSISGLWFYKYAPNTGPHVGNLWTSSGTLLGTAAFSNETSAGWQQATFATPVTITANTTYIASYHTNTGFYASTDGAFGAGVDRAPLHVPSDGSSGGNGVYLYGQSSGFPNQTWNASNYWVDVTFSPRASGTAPPTVTAMTPAGGASNVPLSSAVSATFSQAMTASTMTTASLMLTAPGDASVPATVGYNTATFVATLTPAAALAASTTYTATVKGGPSGVKDATGHALANDVTWTFTTDTGGCPCTLWPSSAAPAHIETSDLMPVELGMRFSVDTAGTVNALRFYKGAPTTMPHVGHLWTSTGTLLGAVTFASETASGWQQANFATPIAVAPNTTYVVSYYAPEGQYAADSFYFGAGIDAGPLHVPADGAGGANGVYQYGASGFPSNTYQSSNYWVDVVFAPSAAPPAAGLQAFTVIVVPDTQCYTSGGAPEHPGSCGAPPTGSVPMLQTGVQWIVANQATLNIAAVLGVGDVTECGDADAEWTQADASYRLLDQRNLPYLLAIGNHDYDGSCTGALRSRVATKFNTWFGKPRYASDTWYGGSTYPASGSENSYITFDVGADKFLALSLELFPRDAALAWATQVLETHADRQVIIVTHAYLSVEGLRQETATNPGPSAYNMTDANDGEAVWTKLASRYGNVIAVINGHAGGSTGRGAVAARTDVGVMGNVVVQMLSNYQFDAGGGSGYLRVLNIRPATRTMSVRTYSPYLDHWLTDAGNEFTLQYGAP